MLQGFSRVLWNAHLALLLLHVLRICLGGDRESLRAYGQSPY